MSTAEPGGGPAGRERQFLVLLNRAVGNRVRAITPAEEDSGVERTLAAVLASCVAERGQLTIVLHGDRLECHGGYVDAASVDALALPLARQGLKSITFQSDADERTLDGVLTTLSGRRSGGGGQADDTVTLLWKQDLPGLSYQADLAELLSGAADGDDLAAKAGEIFETLVGDAARAEGALKPPPLPPPDLVAQLLMEEASKADSLTSDALQAVSDALTHPKAPDHLSNDDVRRLLLAAVGGLAEAGAAKELARLVTWLRMLIQGSDDHANPFSGAVRSVALRSLEDGRLRGFDVGGGRSMSDVVSAGLAETADVLLQERFQTSRGDAAAKTLITWSRRDARVARRALVERLDSEADDPTVVALLAAVGESAELHDRTVCRAVVGLGDTHPGHRVEVMEALAAHNDCDASLQMWDWIEQLKLASAPSATRGRVLAIMPLIVGMEPALAYFEALLRARSLFRSTAQTEMQLSAVRALGEYGNAGARVLLERHMEHKSKEVRAAVAKALATWSGE